MTEAWRQLDGRVLVIHPLKVLRQFAIPALVALVGIGTSNAGLSLMMLPVALVGAVLLGALPWLTTRYQVSDTQLRVRTGLLQRRLTTAPRDRVRTVDLEASPLHRVLGLTKVVIGTGVDDTRIELDALSLEEAHALRGALLSRPALALAEGEEPPPAPPVDEVLARIDWAWLRVAPFSLGRLVVLAGAIGALSQFGDLDQLVPSRLEEAARDLLALDLVLALTIVVLGGLAIWVAVAVLGYVVQWWGFRLSRDETNVRLTAGLFTTRSTTVEVARVRGVQLHEPVLLRVAGGAELAALATGVGKGGVAKVLPPCPAPVAHDVGDRLVGSTGPLAVPLVVHGPRARRRRHVQAQLRTLAISVAATFGTLVASLPWWPAVALGVTALVGNVVAAEAAYRHLGHALTGEHLVVGAPTVARTRTVLETDGVIGWVVVQSWWQRRAGLSTLVATTAAGAESVVAVDVPTGVALAVADAATPGLLTPFLAN